MKKSVVFVLCIAMVLGLVTGCSNTDSGSTSTTGQDKEKEDPKTNEKEKTEDITPTKEEPENNELIDILDTISDAKAALPDPVDPKSVDYSKVDFTLEYTDGDKMKEFMEGYKNEKYDNKVVKITGIMSTGMIDKTKNSVLLKVGDGMKLGPQWIVVEPDESFTYPADDSIIEVTGVVIASWNDDWYASEHYIYVLPENVKNVEIGEGQ